jgi:tetratricopeptide (TPR) repeat protein
MRVHGIEKLGEQPASSVASATSRPWLAPVLIVAALALAVAAWTWWARRTPDAVEGDPPLTPLADTRLAGYARKAGVELGELRGLFVADDALESFAARATAGKSGAIERARGVVAALRARADARAFVPWSLTEPRESPPLTAAAAHARIARDGARAMLYPLEVVAIAVAALRAEGVDAMVAEAFAFPGERTPPDPSGHLGYFVVAVWSGEVGRGAPTLLDPYAGRQTQPAEGDYRVLTDVEAAGLALNARAIGRLVREGDAPKALADSGLALRLAGRSPTVRGARGAILLASGGIDEGMRELEAAAELRSDAPRRNNLAALALARGDTERAEREVSAALEAAPDFAGGHATLAAIHLARGETAEARRAIETARRLDPDLPTLPLLLAQLALGEGEIDEAIRHAEESARRRPHDVQPHLVLGQIYRQAGRYGDMRRAARAAVEAAPAGQRDQVRLLVTRLMGPTALEDDPAGAMDEDAPDEDTGGETAGSGPGGLALGGSDLPEPGFRLGGRSRLLGSEPETEEGESAPADGRRKKGPLLRLGDTSKIRLGGANEGLRIDLNR